MNLLFPPYALAPKVALGYPQSMNLRTIGAVVLAGIVGVVVVVGIGIVFFDPAFVLLFLGAPELFPFGIALAAMIPAIDRTLPEARGTALVIYPLTLGAVLVVALMRLGDAGDPHVLALSLAFAVTAALVYRLARGREEPSGPSAQQ